MALFLGSRPALAAQTGFAKSTSAERRPPKKTEGTKGITKHQRWTAVAIAMALAKAWAPNSLRAGPLASATKSKPGAWDPTRPGRPRRSPRKKPSAPAVAPSEGGAFLRAREAPKQSRGLHWLLWHPRRESDTRRPQHLPGAFLARRAARGRGTQEGAYRPTAMADDGRGIAAVPPAAWALAQSHLPTGSCALFSEHAQRAPGPFEF